MRYFLPALALAALAAPPCHAEQLRSVYTDFDADKTCKVIERAAEGDGDWAEFACSGYKDYPVRLSYDDARESLFYGFAPEDAGEIAWESFSAFNSAGPKIEWRLDADGAPFATIHRRKVSDPDNPDSNMEVLVIARVAQKSDRQGCTVALVRASGNPAANEEARRIADEQARHFDCGADKPAISGKVPGFARHD